MRYIFVLISSFLLLNVSSVRAEPLRLWSVGIGLTECEKWQKIQSTDIAEQAIMSWSFGFVTAANINLLNNSRPQKNIEFLTKDLVLSRLQKFCEGSSGGQAIWPAIVQLYADLPDVQ